MVVNEKALRPRAEGLLFAYNLFVIIYSFTWSEVWEADECAPYAAGNLFKLLVLQDLVLQNFFRHGDYYLSF